MKARQHRQRWLTLIVLLLVLGGIGLYLNANRSLLTLLVDISWPLAFGMVLLRLLFVGLNGYYLKLFAQTFGVQLRVREWFGLAFITTMGNYLTPLSGGMVARATYLKVRHSLPYAKFLSLLTASYLIVFWVAGFLGLVATILLGAAAQGRLVVLVFIVFMVTAVTIVFFL
ncbi:MAG: flippase-like domain-containing protein, partial [Anaerolineales bacterium]|nr:flippase-like domain-containing protein [Anaerolineales bacterium]